MQKGHMGGGDHYPSVQKGQTAPCSGYAVCINAKRSTGTVELANMGGGDPYPPHSGYAVRSGHAVHSRCKCKKVIWVVGTVTFQCKKVKPPRTVDAVHTVNGSY